MVQNNAHTISQDQRDPTTKRDQVESGNRETSSGLPPRSELNCTSGAAAQHYLFLRRVSHDTL